MRPGHDITAALSTGLAVLLYEHPTLQKATSFLISKALQIRPGPASFRDLPRRRLDPVSCSRAGPLRNTGRYHLLMLLLIISRDFKKFEHILHTGRTWPQTNMNINRFVYVNLSSYDYNWTHTPQRDRLRKNKVCINSTLNGGATCAGA